MSLLTRQQLTSAERYEIGLAHLVATVERLNDLGRDLQLPPLAIRCCGSTLLAGENAASSNLNRKLIAHHLAEIKLMREERRAA